MCRRYVAVGARRVHPRRGQANVGGRWRCQQSPLLSQRDASRLLGGGRHAFERYEARRLALSEAMANLLRLLDHDPKRLDELRTAREERAGYLVRIGGIAERA